MSWPESRSTQASDRAATKSDRGDEPSYGASHVPEPTHIPESMPYIGRG